jgi:hypothetical protein
MLVRSLGLGEIKDKRPELFPRFFEVDLAPCILKFLRRSEGGYCNELMKAADCIPCTVMVWFSSILPLLLALEGMSFVEHTKRHTTSEVAGFAAQFSKEGFTLFVSGVSMVVFEFCMRGLRVLWPKHFEGELPLHDVDYHSGGGRILIAWQAINAMLMASSK